MRILGTPPGAAGKRVRELRKQGYLLVPDAETCDRLLQVAGLRAFASGPVPSADGSRHTYTIRSHWFRSPLAGVTIAEWLELYQWRCQPSPEAPCSERVRALAVLQALREGH